jgi:GNAT superfamily N-acetyltransferase
VAEARLRRAHAARAAIFERAAERVVALDWGSALFHPAVPRWLDLNAVRVEVPAPGLDAARLDRAVERVQAALPHRRLEIFDEPTAVALVPGLDDRGWMCARSLLMAWDGGDPAPAPEVEQVPYSAVRRLREEWIRSEPWAVDDDLVAQVLEADRITFAANPTRAYAVVRDGRPIAFGLLLEVDGAGFVEDVYTTPAARGQGLGGAVVRRLVWESRTAGHDDTFVPTDADGRAQALYRRLGFSALGVVHRFLRWPG